MFRLILGSTDTHYYAHFIKDRNSHTYFVKDKNLEFLI